MGLPAQRDGLFDRLFALLSLAAPSVLCLDTITPIPLWLEAMLWRRFCWNPTLVEMVWPNWPRSERWSCDT